MAPKWIRSAGGLVAWLAGTLALPCVALDLEPKFAGSSHVSGGPAMDVVIAGDYAYVVVSESGLHVIDISDPTEPRPIAGYRSGGYAVDVAVSGTYAYLVVQQRLDGTNYVGGGLHVIDISTPANPQRVGGYSSPQPKAVALSGSYAYVINGSGLQVVDISNPNNPQIVGSASISGASEVAASGDHAYVVFNQGFQMFDVSDPANPGLVGLYTTNGFFQELVILGNHGYLADGNAGVHIVDISDPANLQLIGRYACAAFDLAISGSYAYVATQPRTVGGVNFPGGLHVVDISQLANPQRLGHYADLPVLQGVAASGNHAYVVDANALTAINISNPADPRRAGCHFVQKDARDLALSGRYAYVADGVAGLEIFEISDPTNLERVGGLFIGAAVNSIVIADNHAFLVSSGALHVIDINIPISPRQLARYDISGDARNVSIAGNFAYAAAKSGGLHVIDIGDPANPQRVGGYLNSNAVDVAIAGNYAYLTAEPYRRGGTTDVPGYLDVIDISNPASPNRVGRYVTSEHTHGVAAAGDYAYVGDGRAGLQVINISNPAKPEHVATVAPSSYQFPNLFGDFIGSIFTSVTVSNNHCYAAEMFLRFGHGIGPIGSSLQIIDITNPPAPKRVGSVRAGEYDESLPHVLGTHAQGMVVAGNYVFVAGGKAGLQVMDIRNPAPSQVLAHYFTGGYAPGIAVANNYAYVAEQRRWTGSNHVGGGLQIIDISDPANPQRVGTYDTGDASDVAVSGTRACVLVSAALDVFDIGNPAVPNRLAHYSLGVASLKLTLSGNHAYVLARQQSNLGGLHVININDPANPQRVAIYNNGAEAYDIALSGNYAYMAHAPRPGFVNGGLQIIDISNPTNPWPAGTYSVASSARGVAVAGNYAYLAGDASGLHVIDISSPGNPQRVGFNDSIGPSERVAVLGNYAYVVDSEARLHVVDIRDPARPQRIGSNTSFTGFYDHVVSSVAVGNGKVFVGTSAKGLFILHPYQSIRFEHVTADVSRRTIRLQISGPPAVSGRVQRSADLLNWTDWLPVNFGEVALEVVDSDASSAGFYRVAVP